MPNRPFSLLSLLAVTSLRAAVGLVKSPLPHPLDNVTSLVQIPWIIAKAASALGLHPHETDASSVDRIEQKTASQKLHPRRKLLDELAGGTRHMPRRIKHRRKFVDRSGNWNKALAAGTRNRRKLLEGDRGHEFVDVSSSTINASLPLHAPVAAAKSSPVDLENAEKAEEFESEEKMAEKMAPPISLDDEIQTMEIRKMEIVFKMLDLDANQRLNEHELLAAARPLGLFNGSDAEWPDAYESMSVTWGFPQAGMEFAEFENLLLLGEENDGDVSKEIQKILHTQPTETTQAAGIIEPSEAAQLEDVEGTPPLDAQLVEEMKTAVGTEPAETTNVTVEMGPIEETQAAELTLPVGPIKLAKVHEPEPDFKSTTQTELPDLSEKALALNPPNQGIRTDLDAERMENIFKRLDLDADHRLNQHEFLKVARPLGFYTGSDAEWPEMYKSMCEELGFPEAGMDLNDFESFLLINEENDGDVFEEIIQISKGMPISD